MHVIRTTLSWYIALCAVLVLIVQGLSVLHLVTLPALGGAVTIVAITVVLVKKPRRVSIGIHLAATWVELRSPLALPFVLILPVMIVVLFALGWHMPPNNWDAMTYHLSRAAYWRQWQTLAHFPTNNLRQDVFPGNAEVLLLVTLLLAHSAGLAFLVQFTAYLAATLAVYGLGRQLGLSTLYAVIGAGAFATMPEVVLQSTSTQNDLTVAAFAMCGVYFFVDAVREGRWGSVVLTGAAIGLAIGTKPTVALALPGLGAGAVALLWSSRHRLRVTRRGVAGIAGALSIATFLGAPWYIANRLDYGALTGPPDVSRMQNVSHPSFDTLRANLLRHVVGLIDPVGPALLTPQTAVLACSQAAQLRATMATATGIARVEPAIEWPGIPYSSAPPCSFHEDSSWFGLAGWIAVTVALVWTIAAVMHRRVQLSWLLAAGATSFLIFASLLLRWQPWEGRLLVMVAALSSPLLGLLARKAARHRLSRPVLLLMVMYVAAGGLSAAVDNEAKPLTAWRATSAEAQVLTNPAMGPVLARVAQTVPANARMGVFLNGDDWDFPLFGQHLDRIIEPLTPSSAVTATTGPSTPPYVLTHQPIQAVERLFHQLRLSSCQITWSIERGDTLVPWRLYDCRSASARAHPPASARIIGALSASLCAVCSSGEQHRGLTACRGDAGDQREAGSWRTGRAHT